MGKWSGKEKRKIDLSFHADILSEIHDLKLNLSSHIGDERSSLEVIKGDVKVLSTRINGSLDKIGSFMESGLWYRRLIITTAVSLVLTILGGIFTASSISYYVGGTFKQVQINTKRLDLLETK